MKKINIFLCILILALSITILGFVSSNSKTETYKIEHCLTSCEVIPGRADSISSDDLPYIFQYYPEDGYKLPNSVKVICNGKTLSAGTDYTWTYDGVLTLKKVTGDIKIYINGVKISSAVVDAPYGTYVFRDSFDGESLYDGSGTAACEQYDLSFVVPGGLYFDGDVYYNFEGIRVYSVAKYSSNIIAFVYDGGSEIVITNDWSAEPVFWLQSAGRTIVPQEMPEGKTLEFLSAFFVKQ